MTFLTPPGITTGAVAQFLGAWEAKKMGSVTEGVLGQTTVMVFASTAWTVNDILGFYNDPSKKWFIVILSVLERIIINHFRTSLSMSEFMISNLLGP